MRTAILTGLLAFLANIAMAAEGSIDQQRLAERLLSQEVQEIQFFKQLCIEMQGDPEAIRAYFSELEKGGIPVRETTKSFAPTYKMPGGDHAIATWDVVDPVTKARDLVILSNFGKCSVYAISVLDHERMREEFKQFANATAVWLKKTATYKPEPVPPGVDLVVDTYEIPVTENKFLVLGMSVPGDNAPILLTLRRIQRPN